jgi:hypothetical protein
VNMALLRNNTSRYWLTYSIYLFMYSLILQWQAWDRALGIATMPRAGDPGLNSG